PMTSSARVVLATSTETFESALASAKPGGLCLLHFRADWAAQCVQMSLVMDELAKEPAYSAVTFVNVEAEQVPQVTSRFGVLAVPTFLLVRRAAESQQPQVVDRLNGADPAALAAKLSAAVSATARLPAGRRRGAKRDAGAAGGPPEVAADPLASLAVHERLARRASLRLQPADRGAAAEARRGGAFRPLRHPHRPSRARGLEEAEQLANLPAAVRSRRVAGRSRRCSRDGRGRRAGPRAESRRDGPPGEAGQGRASHAVHERLARRAPLRLQPADRGAAALRGRPVRPLRHPAGQFRARGPEEVQQLADLPAAVR
ncbi:hypothetical protein BOX15_Mlig022978g8, partial [Macrostomum lignano]